MYFLTEFFNIKLYILHKKIKDIPKISFILLSISKNFSLNNQTLFNLLKTTNLVLTIL